MATSMGDGLDDLRRRLLGRPLLLRRLLRRYGMVEEYSAGMGRVITVSADPRLLRLDVSADAPGWERVQTLRARPWR
jgi:hypothetical protein